MDIMNSTSSTTDSPNDIYTNLDNIFSNGCNYTYHNDYGSGYHEYVKVDLDKDTREFSQIYNLFNIHSDQLESESISRLDPVVSIYTTGHIRDFSHNQDRVHFSLDNTQLDFKLDLSALKAFNAGIDMQKLNQSQ